MTCTVDEKVVNFRVWRTRFVYTSLRFQKFNSEREMVDTIKFKMPLQICLESEHTAPEYTFRICAPHVHCRTAWFTTLVSNCTQLSKLP